MSLLLASLLALQPDPAAGALSDKARIIGGSISNRDYPSSFGRRGIGGTTAVRFLVNEQGRVAACEVTGTSGTAELDAIVCRLAQQRFRFRPARDAGNRAVPQWLGLRWTWQPPRSIRIEDGAFEPVP